MLSIGKIAAGPAAARYYTDQVARGREDYYAGEGEEPGSWVGSGAGGAGLSGGVEPERFADLLAGAGLRRPVRDGAIAGFDLTFPGAEVGQRPVGRRFARSRWGSAPGHDAAVGEALGYLERHACRARLGAGGHLQVDGRGFAAAAFVHRTSREGDPLLHPRRRREHFSRRRAQILEHMAEHSGRSAASAQVAALETRRAKCEVAVDRLREVWRSRAAEHGLDAPAVERVLDRDRRISLALPIDPDALTEAASTFGRAELLQALAETQPTGARVDELEHLADAALRSPQIVRLRDGAAAARVIEPRFTTQDMLRVERNLLECTAARRSADVAVADPDAVEDAIAERGLSSEQRAVVHRLATSGEGVSVLRAAAGTGKTFALDAAREAWEASGVDVVGCAVSARAALELQDQAGIESLTIASLRRRLDRGEELPRDGVLVVDEAGMAGTRTLAELAHAVLRVEGKLVLVGDDRQLPEIEAGGAFHALAERLEACELSEVHRQREAWDRDALNALRRGEVERWARAYRARGQITVARSAPTARAALVNDWSRADGDVLMIAARRDDVADLNQPARELLQADGRLGPDEIDAHDRRFSRGDRIVARHNDRTRGILNGQRGTVRDIDHDRRAIEVELDRGERVTLDAAYLDAGYLDHGYAITAHRAQGATVDRTFVLGSEELYREWGYTALSRHRDQARFYIARGDLDLDLDQAPEPDDVAAGLERIMGRSRAKELAHDGLADVDPAELQRDRDLLRKDLEHAPPPEQEAVASRDLLDTTAEALNAARERANALREQREATPWFHRSERRELKAWLDLSERHAEDLGERFEAAQVEHDLAAAAEECWLSEHGDAAARYLALGREVDRRELADRDAAARISQVARRPEPPIRALEPPAPSLDVDLDFDLGP